MGPGRLLPLVLAGLLAGGPAWAQNYPERPVKLVVPFAPAGAADVIARLWADGMKTLLGPVFLRSALRQVSRQAHALRSYPDILMERAGIDSTGKTIVPCVLNSLPFSMNGCPDGVYVTDWSALKRFFDDSE